MNDHQNISRLRAASHCKDKAAMKGFCGLFRCERICLQRYLTPSKASSELPKYMSHSTTHAFNDDGTLRSMP